MSRTSLRNNLEYQLLTRLYPGPRNVTDLVEEVSYLQKVSVQGVYKALRALKKEEIVTVHNHTVSLSLIWVAKEREKFIFIEQAYRSGSNIDILRNGTKKRVHFTFHTLNEIDLFWTHSYLLLAHTVKNDTQTYSIHPHDWYMYVRYDTDTYWVRKHRESARVSRTVLTHPASLDRAVVRERKKQLGKLFEYTLNENPLKQNSCTYYNILGPYIFIAQFDPVVAAELDRFVATHDTLPLNRSAQEEITAIVAKRGTFRLSIEVNEKKATAMRNKVKKLFEF